LGLGLDVLYMRKNQGGKRYFRSAYFARTPLDIGVQTLYSHMLPKHFEVDQVLLFPPCEELIFPEKIFINKFQIERE
jgi:hypothetical protein